MFTPLSITVIPELRLGLGESHALLTVSLLGIRLKILSTEKGIISRSPTMHQSSTVMRFGAFLKIKRRISTASNTHAADMLILRTDTNKSPIAFTLPETVYHLLNLIDFPL